MDGVGVRNSSSAWSRRRHAAREAGSRWLNGVGRRRGRRFLATAAFPALAVIVSVAGYSAPALAYRTGHDLPELSSTARVRWHANEIHFEFNQNVPQELRIGDVMQSIADEFSEWSSLKCSVPYFQSDGPVARDATRGDGHNTIQWVYQGWTARGFKADSEALTDVQYARQGSGDWEIVEADLYLNAESFTWALGGSSDPSVRDLHSVALHEAGHAIGLLHPCEPDGSDGAPKCSSDPSFAATTMYPLYYSPRVLSADDEAGACFLYPAGDCGTACTPPCGDALTVERCGCASLCGVDAGMQIPFRFDAGSDARASKAKAGGAGDPCGEGLDCSSGVCLDGECSRTCRTNSECASSQRCDPQGGYCVGPGKKLGQTCATADECVGGECVAGTENGSVCSRPCGSGDPACPDSWFCQAISGRQVCTPPVMVATGGSGCALSSSPNLSTSSPQLCAALVAAGTLFGGSRRRRARRRRRKGAE